MSKFHSVCILGMLVFAFSVAWGQDSSAQTPSTPENGQQQPVPAYGQENAPPPISENPPLSGLDLPSLEPHAAPLSYLQPGATFSETADSNVGNNLGNQSFTSVSRALGSLTLQRLWSNYDLALDYMGGFAYYDVQGQGAKLLQQMDLDQKVTWKRGQLSLRDSFSYLPEGNFGAAYGSLGSVGISSLGSSVFNGILGGGVLGSLGLAPRILNISVADISENLTPKSAVTAAGGYAFTHFYGNDFSGASFIGGSQVSGQVGYNRILTSHTQVALVYGYEGFDFSVLGTAFHSHVIQAMYGHRISGRMDLLIGAGPQITFIDTGQEVCSNLSLSASACVPPYVEIPIAYKDTRIGVAGQARLRYRFPRTSLDLSYLRFVTNGSGLFAGAQTDIARLSVERPLNRVWDGFADMGYSRNGRVQPLTPQQMSECGSSSQSSTAACPVNDATVYSYGFAGVGVHRAFGHSFHGFASYQFNELSFNNSFCVSGTPCNRIGNRSVISVGLDWTPRPIRID